MSGRSAAPAPSARDRSRLPFALLGLLFLTPAVSRPDAVAYMKVVDLRAESAELVVEHHHDWSRETQAARWKMVSGSKDPFGAENSFSTLRVSDRKSGRELFSSPVPALTFLWISEDSRYVVGLSNIKLQNAVQIVVFDRSGRRLFEKGLAGQPLPGVFESVTNAIFWYREPTPALRLEEGRDGWATLTVEGREGAELPFRFRTAGER